MGQADHYGALYISLLLPPCMKIDRRTNGRTERPWEKFWVTLQEARTYILPLLWSLT